MNKVSRSPYHPSATTPSCSERKTRKDVTPSSSHQKKTPAPSHASKSEARGASTEMPDGIRLNKALADAGICSRRKADTLIQNGCVTVNGAIVRDMGVRVHAGKDTVIVNGKVLPLQTAHCYIMVHKPIHTLCTVSDPEGRTTVLDLLPERWRGIRLYPVGRLDYFSEGLIVLTNDGAFAQKMTHPSHNLSKTYHVSVREKVTDTMLESMRRGMTLAEGEKLAPVKVRVLPPQEGQKATMLEMVLSQGINRQIRRMCRDLGLTILRLVRVSQGALQLGGLAVGEVRELTSEELNKLFNL